MGTLHFQLLLEEDYNPNWDYLLILPSSLPVKEQEGFSLLLDKAGDVQGQPLYLVGRPKKELN